VRPTLGISANDDVSRRLIGEDADGVLVLGVTAGSPAARAGLRATEMTANGRVTVGDVIEAVDGRPVENFAALVNILDAREFGDRITLTVRRGQQRVEVPITLGSASAARSQ
jgi:S1-C subfamily serine protease